MKSLNSCFNKIIKQLKLSFSLSPETKFQALPRELFLCVGIPCFFYLALWSSTMLFPFYMVNCSLRADSVDRVEEEELNFVIFPVFYIYDKYSEYVSIWLVSLFPYFPFSIYFLHNNTLTDQETKRPFF